LAIILPLAIQTDLLFLTDLAKAPLPRSERSGYLEIWTAGYGLKEIAQFLIVQAQQGTVVVGTEGSFGTLPDGLMIYLDEYFHSAPEDKKILVIGGKNEISQVLRESAKEHRTFFVANRSRFLGDQDLQLIKQYPKAMMPKGQQDAILFYEVFPSKSF
jgi:hypothetical protein